MVAMMPLDILGLRLLPRLLAVAALAASAGPARAAEPPAAPIALGAPKNLDAAATAIEQATGAHAGAIVPATGPSIPLADGRSFAMDAKTAQRLLAGSHASFMKAGFYLFRYERGYGLEKDRVGVMATADRDVIIRRIGTSGHRLGITGEQIAAWLRQLEKDEAVVVDEIGSDFVAGRFERTPKDPVALAKRVAQFAPDLVTGHKDPIGGLADFIHRGTLLLIWD
jgi:hypothetical protein